MKVWVILLIAGIMGYPTPAIDGVYFETKDKCESFLSKHYDKVINKFWCEEVILPNR